MSIYNFTANSIDGEKVDFNKYKGEVLLIVNTASKCGFTHQLEDLQSLYQEYKEKGFMILGFPCNQFAAQEPGTNKETKEFCKLNYGVTFNMFEKIEVNGKNAHPIFNFLIGQAPFEGFDMSNPSNKILDSIINDKYPELSVGDYIKWNFTKFLIDREGNVIKRYESAVEPNDIKQDIDKLI